MVHLNRIYTRSGDAGQTSLGDGRRVAKTDSRIAAYGAVDELNSVLGVAMSASLPDDLRAWLIRIQNDLFDLGADLCVPESPETAQRLRVTADQVQRLEGWIDRLNDRLTALTSFVLPGGTEAAARMHHGRAVCRRAEIGVWALAESEPVNPQVLAYLNRLSDLLFVAARVCNDDGRGDVLWVPGGERTTE